MADQKKDRKIGQCRRCHRKLSTPECVAAGLGKVCFKKLTGRTLHALKAERPLKVVKSKLAGFNVSRGIRSGNFSKDIVCSRSPDGDPVANIKRRHTLHSPDGFEWGYGGSGPSDFALNILSLFVPFETARDLHQQFKWDFIAAMPRSGGVIKNSVIRGWLRERGFMADEELNNAREHETF